mgnify:CR=1 FL=1
METLNYIKPIDLSKCNLKEQLNQRFGVASLMQVDAKGPQDTHIHDTIHDDNNKSIFQNEYKRHTLFFPWYEELEFNQVPKFGEHFIFSIPVKRKFMIEHLYIQINLPDITSFSNNSNSAKYVNNVGFKLIKNVKFTLNGEVLSEYTGEYLRLITMLYTPHSKIDGVKSLTGMFDSDDNINGYAKELFIHLPIFPSTFFPLHAIYNSEFLVDITFETLENIVNVYDNTNSIWTRLLKLDFNSNLNTDKIIPSISFNSHFEDSGFSSFVNQHLEYISSKMFLDYQIIYDEDESKILITNEQEFVYESVEVQEESLRKGIQSINLHFNSRVKQLIFVFSKESPKRIKMYLNSGEIEYSNSFHTHIQPFFYDTKILDESSDSLHTRLLRYSFSMYPYLNQPSGTLHFGTLHTKTLMVDTDSEQTLTIYAICYKILKISRGLTSVI